MAVGAGLLALGAGLWRHEREFESPVGAPGQVKGNNFAMNLGVDPRHADQMVRGVVTLPKGTGKTVRVGVFARGAKADEAKAAGADVVGAEDLLELVTGGTIGLDWNMDIPVMRSLVGDSKTLQGNLDPCALYGSHQSIESETIKMLNSFGNNKRHIVNLGHGVYPDVDPEKVKTFIKTVKSYETK